MTKEQLQLKARVLKPMHVGKRYRHFKGNIYKIIDIGVHSETDELLVIYCSEDNPTFIWCRPLDMFFSPVDHEKYPDVKQLNRFELID